MGTHTPRSVHESLRAALPGWIERRALLDSDVLQALAREGVEVAPDEVDLVVESLIAEVDRELKWMIEWENKEQAGHDFLSPDIDLPTLPRKKKCWRLLSWAGSHGVGARVTDVYRSMNESSIHETFPEQVDGVIKWLTSYRGPSYWDEAREEETEADDDRGGSHD
jgi:hypothetical protein